MKGVLLSGFLKPITGFGGFHHEPCSWPVLPELSLNILAFLDFRPDSKRSFFLACLNVVFRPLSSQNMNCSDLVIANSVLNRHQNIPGPKLLSNTPGNTIKTNRKFCFPMLGRSPQK